MKYTSYLTMLAVLLAAACTKDDITETVTQPAPENAISFSGQMKPADGDTEAPGTRTAYGDNGTAITVEWAEGDEIGVFAKAGDELIASNYGYRTRSAGKETTFGFMIYDDAVCWADETTEHDFYAYYPYSKTTGDDVPDYTAVPVTLPAEQVYDPADPQGQFAALDFMYAAATGQTQAAVGQGSVPLQFSHLFSILEVKVTTDRFATIDGIVLLNDHETGSPAAVLDGQAVTAWRTGAVGGTGIRHLAAEDAHTAGIVGAGVQGFYQAVYACAAREIHTVYVYNHSDRDLTDYLLRLKKAIDNPGTKVVQCKTVEELVRQSDIICTTTPSEIPVLPNDAELLRGKCIIAIGSYTPQMREIPDAIWDVAERVYIELPYACEESGDLCQPLAEGRLTQDRVVLMSDYLSSADREVSGKGKTTYFKSVGMGLFDVCIAQKILEIAKER